MSTRTAGPTPLDPGVNTKNRSASSFRTALATAVALTLVHGLAAQRVHSLGLVGDLPPDGSTWPHPAAPDGNRFVRSTAGVGNVTRRNMLAQLGKTLFWDEQVSSDNSMACGTCHMPHAGGTDPRTGAVFFDPASPNHGNFGSFGVIRQSFHAMTQRVDYGFQAAPSPNVDRQVTPVAAPTAIGAYLYERLFWDRRAGPAFRDSFGVALPNFGDFAALEDLAVAPPMSPVEMGHEAAAWSTGFLPNKLSRARPLALATAGTIPADVTGLLATFAGQTYGAIFDAMFQSHPQFGGANVGVTRERFALAVAHYHRTLIPDRAPIDLGTMTANQVAGFNFLKSNASCFACHSASGNPTLTKPGGVLANPFDNLFADGLLHQIGVTPLSPPRKTPTLRNIGLHRKFFSTGHGGDGVGKVLVTSFAQLIDFYDAQPGFLGINGSGPGGVMTAIERARVIDFLQNALTDPRVAAATAPFDRPGLRSEAVPFEANEYGAGTPGVSLLTPAMIATVPELVVAGTTPQWFKIGVGNAPPNRPALLMVGTGAAAGPALVGGALSVVAAPATNAQGISTVHVPFPLTAATIGVPVFTQWRIDDFGTSALSNGARFTPF